MLDLAFIRSNPDAVKEAARLKNNNIDIDYLLEVDRKVTALQRLVEDMRAQQNQLSKRMQQAGKDKAQRNAIIGEGKQIYEQIKAIETEISTLIEERPQFLYLVPKITHHTPPLSKHEKDKLPRIQVGG